MKTAMTDYAINELIKKRWSPRSFDNKQIDDSILMSLFEAARWAPSSMNEQPWEFIAVKKENSESFQKLVDSLNEGNRVWAKYAPVLVIVTARKHFAKEGWLNRTSGYDTGHAVANFTIQALEHNIYVHQMGGFSQEKVRENFQIDDDKEIMVVMTIGYLGDPDRLDEKLKKREISPRTRKNFEEFVQIIK